MFTSARSTTHLPRQSTPFIGRASDVKEVARLLRDPTCQILTLVGPGGIGKTRLALEVARSLSFADGIYFIDLQPVNTDEMLITTIANALGMMLSGPQDPRQQILSILSERETLLLLDNFEQLLDHVDLLADLVARAPGIKLLVTSREALNIAEEWLWQVGGLQVPDHKPPANIESYSAVQLFTERARRTRQDFSIAGQEQPITRICQLVDGMPLALELAASWTKALSCVEIAHEIQRSMDFLTTNMRNVPQRHQSMLAVFDQSWRLLTDDERRVFPHLSVFRGGFRREAAEQVAGASLAVLAGLVDKSFLRLSGAGRYEIHELIRQYGEEHLNAIPAAKNEAQNRHCAYYADFLHQQKTVLRGQEQARALDEIGDELDNIRVSWEWAIAHNMAHEIHQSMHSLFLFCHIRSHAVEGERLFDLATKRFEQEDSAVLAYLFLARTWMARFNGRFMGVDQYPRAIRLVYTFWTDDEITMPLQTYFHIRSKLVSNNLFDDQRQEQVYRHFLEIFRTNGQAWGVAYIFNCLGELSEWKDNLDEAEKYYRESHDHLIQIGDRWAAAWSSMGLADVFERSERYDEAHQQWQAHQDICAVVGDRGAAVHVPAMRARIAWKQKDNHAARIYIAQGIKSHLELGASVFQLDEVFRSLIMVFVNENRHERAAELSSFLRQHADSASAPKIADVAHQNLDLLAQKLPPDIYLKAIERGKTINLRTILEQLQDDLAGGAPSRSSHMNLLTERELEVLRLLAAGHSNREITRELVLTLNTVKSHIHHIYGKLGVESRTQAVVRARELNLLA